MKDVTTLQKNGRVTIPKHIREAMGLEAGDRVDITVKDDGNVYIRKLQNSLEKQ